MPRGRPRIPNSPTPAQRMAKLRAERHDAGWLERTIALTPNNAVKAAALTAKRGVSLTALVNDLIEKEGENG